MVVGINHQTKFTATISDTNEHDVPNADGSGASTGKAMTNRAAIDARGQDRVVAHVINDEGDNALTARLEAAMESDPDFTNPIEIISDTSVAAGDSHGFEDDERSYAFYRVVFSYDSTPGDADNLTVEWGFKGLR